MRTTGVRLEAETGQYIRGVEQAAKSTHKLKDEVDEVGRSSDTTGRKVDDLGDDFRDTARDANKLQDEIKAVERSLAGLAAEFVATSSAADRLELTKSIRKQQGELRQLLKVQKLLPTPAEMKPATQSFARNLATGVASAAPQAAAGFASQFAQQLGPMISKTPLSGPLGIVAAGAAAAAAPLIGATISAAVIGGAGIGGVIGGILLAARDERVKTAGAELGQGLLGDLEARARRTFLAPVLDSITRIERGFAGMGGDLDRIFTNSARLIRPLTDGAIAFVQRITTGVADLTDAAGPVIDVLSQGVADMGNEIANAFAMLKDNGVDAATALHVVFTAVNGTIRATGIAVNLLTESFGFLAKIGAFGEDARQEYLRLEANAKIAAAANRDVADSLSFVSNQGYVAGSAMKGLITEVVKLHGPVNLAADAANAHRRAMRGEVGAMTDLNTATRAMIDPLFAFTEAQKKVKTAQDKATEAVRNHGRNSVEARTATRNLAAAALDLQARAGALAVGFNGKLTPSMYATFRAAGLTKQQIRDVEGQLKTARAAADKYDGKYNADVTVTGGKKAASQLSALSSMQRALKQGIPLSIQARRAFAFADGGWTGPGSKWQPAGTVHADEFVIQKESRQKIETRAPGLLDRMNQTGEVPGYAAGGHVVSWPFPTSAAMTQIMSAAEAMSKVMPSFGNWPSSPSAQRGDSGVWRRIVALIRSTGPMSGSFGNAYRPGDPKWHGSGRAVDWMGFNQDRLATFLAARRPLELIHRTNRRDYAYTRGVNKGSFNNALMEAHRNHVHIAMDRGGVIREPVFGIGASGRSYSFAERRPETVIPGVLRPSRAGGGVTNNYVTVQAGYVVSEQDLENKITRTINRLQLKGRA